VLRKSILWARTTIAKSSKKYGLTPTPQPSSDQKSQTLNAIKKTTATSIPFNTIIGFIPTMKAFMNF
jgi:hypothetical protein